MSGASAAPSWSNTASVYHNFAAFTAAFARDAVANAVKARLSSPTPLADGPIRVLDIAAGTGAAALSCIDVLCADTPERHVRVLATDLSEGMLTQLQNAPGLAERLAAYPNVALDTEILDMQALTNVEDASMDLVTLVFGIMFPPDPVAALQEIKRVLAPGGVAVVVTWHWNAFVDAFVRGALAQGKIEREEDFDVSFLKFGEQAHMVRLARRAGLENVSFTFLQHDGIEIPVDFLVGSANSNPSLEKYMPFDEEKLRDSLGIQAAEQFKSGRVKEQSCIEAAGTALCLNIGF